MRYQGRITEWKDERGFGFITPNGGGAKVFVHFKALRKGEPRPAGNELVTYELETANAKGPRAADVAYMDRVRATPRDRAEAPRGGNVFSTMIGVALVIGLAAFGWNHYAAKRERAVVAPPQQEIMNAPSTPKQIPLAGQFAPAATSEAFKCEGKKYCSEMKSCDEAKFYLRNCPGVKIDGDGDGIPCERQLCTP